MKFKRSVITLLVLSLILNMMIPAAFASTPVKSGTIKNNEEEKIDWSLDDEGTMTISGYGAMTDYASSDDQPWVDIRESIKSVDFPDEVYHIGADTFSLAINLSKISLTDSVVSIGENAFNGCDSLEDIYYAGTSGSWTDLLANTDDGNTALTNEEASVHYKVTVTFDPKEGTLENTTKTVYSGEEYEDLPIPEKESFSFDGWYLSPDGDDKITPDSIVKQATNHTLYAKWAEKSTVVWDFDAENGKLTFSGEGKMPSDKPWKEYQSKILSVDIKEGVTSIASYAFSDCSALTNVSIPDTVTEIGMGAFQACVSLNSIAIPNSVTEIEMEAFRGCASLTNVVVPNGIKSLNYGVFWGCTLLNSISLPEGMTYIGSWAFEASPGLTDVIIPESVKTINSGAFWGCSSLKSVVIPKGVEWIDSSAFWGCASLSSISVVAENQDYSSLDGVLFNKDRTILISYPSGKDDKSYSVPSGVETITNRAFRGSTFLESVLLPASISSIGSEAFWGCTSLRSVDVANGNENYMASEGVLFSKDGASLILYPSSKSSVSYQIPDAVDSIRADAFLNCANLESIIASEDNQNYSTKDGVLFSKDETNLVCYPSGKYGETYRVPDSVGYIFEYAFLNSTQLSSIIVSDDNEAFSSLSGVLYNKDKTTLITYPAGKIGSCTIPNTVTDVRYGSFANCKGLTSITIPSSVSYLPYFTFATCTALADVYYGGTKDQWNSMMLHPYFYDGYSLSYYDYDYYNSYNFYSNKALGSATIHCSDGEIDPSYISDVYASGTCGTNITWTLDKSGHLVLRGTGVLPDYLSADALGTAASLNGVAPWYEYRSSILSVAIENGITSIGAASFMNCTSLSTAVIPDSVTNIKDSAFSGCTALDLVNYSGNAQQWNAIVIGSSNEPLVSAKKQFEGVPSRQLDAAVKYVPYFVNLLYYLPDSSPIVSASELDESLGLTIQDGVLSGSPVKTGSYAFLITTESGDYDFTFNVVDNDSTAVSEQGDYSMTQHVTLPDGSTKEVANPVINLSEVRTKADEIAYFTFKSEGKFAEFYAAYLDGVLLNPSQYTVREGSTILTVNTDVMQGLSNGQHTLADEFHTPVSDTSALSQELQKKVQTGTDGQSYVVETSAQNFTITRSEQKPGNGGSSSSSSSGSSGGSSKPSINNAAKSSDSISFTVAQGVATVQALSESQMRDIVNSNKASLTLDLTKDGATVTQAVFPAEFLKQISELLDGDNALTQIQILLTHGALTLNAACTQSIITQCNGNALQLTMEETTADKLNEAQQAELSVSEVAKLITVELSADNKQISSFDGNRVGMSFNFKPSDGHEARGYAAWFVGTDGTTTRHASSCSADSVSFRTSHFSTFAILYSIPVVFSDVADDAWYTSEVDQVAATGLMIGTGKGFEPESTLTRAMLAQILFNAEKAESGAPAFFKDVPADAWYADAVNWLHKAGIAGGTGNGKYDPNSPVTREQMASILYNYTRFKNRDVSATALLDRFSDGADVSAWADVPVKWAVGLGLIDGMDGALVAHGSLTRAQAAKLFVYYFEGFTQ